MRTTLCKNRLPKKRSSRLTCFCLPSVRPNLGERLFNNLVSWRFHPDCLLAATIHRKTLGNLFLQRVVRMLSLSYLCWIMASTTSATPQHASQIARVYQFPRKVARFHREHAFPLGNTQQLCHKPAPRWRWYKHSYWKMEHSCWHSCWLFKKKKDFTFFNPTTMPTTMLRFSVEMLVPAPPGGGLVA